MKRQTLFLASAFALPLKPSPWNAESWYGSCVEHIAAGDTTVVLRSGFKPQAERVPIGPLGMPQNLEAIMAHRQGELKARWLRLTGARSYVVEYCVEGESVWRQAGLSTKAYFTLTGLVSGTRYRVRVSGIGAAGRGRGAMKR